MLLVEADGKALFRAAGIATPDAIETASAAAPPLPGIGPWMVKAQVPAGGRGKAGGVTRCADAAEVAAALARQLALRLKGHDVQTCLVEQAATGTERYLALMLDPAACAVRVLFAAEGGVEVEQAGGIAFRLCAPEVDAIADAIADLVATEPDASRGALLATGRRLAELMLARELMLAEINPLFVSPAGCIAGDAKVVVDLNAIDRQPEIAALLRARPETYADAVRKLDEGFDYVELDPNGEVGLVTTGAGLSMMLVDEMTARGMKPLNFLDIRTGQLRGSPARLIRVLEWIAARPRVKVVLVNIFA
ncbi:MAG: acetate--CoA ligase family protein, partial [Acetobacteraceae bacterium]|nr:acetate--CoA ligase family protein [Acetobacteraceae bacterium]